MREETGKVWSAKEKINWILREIVSFAVEAPEDDTE